MPDIGAFPSALRMAAIIPLVAAGNRGSATPPV